MADNDWTITKRHMGIALMVAGVLGAMGVVVLDVIRGSSDFGPAQQLAVVGCVVLVLLGASLFPLGDRPA